jgi:hypothetical protein
MEILSDHLTRSLTHSEADRSFESWVPVVLAEKRGSCVEQLEIHERDSELVGQINRFHVHPLDEDWSIRLDPGTQYAAQEIPERVRRTLHAGRGDHALIQWEDSPGEPEQDRMEELGQSDLGDFYRDADGRIYVTQRDPRIIGGWGRRDHVRVGRMAARLEPAVVPETDVATQEKQVQPPPAEPTDEAIELHNKLLGLVDGSRETTGRLVEYERRQAPPASLSEVIDWVVARLLGDRRSTS